MDRPRGQSPANSLLRGDKMPTWMCPPPANSVNACYVPATCHVDATSQFHVLLFNADEKQMTN